MRDYSELYQMKNGNYFTRVNTRSGEGQNQVVWSLYNPEFEKIQDIEIQKLKGNSAEFQYQQHISYAGFNRIYIGKRAGQYEISVYGMEGELQRIIKKDYSAIPISEAYKNSKKEQREERTG